MKLYNSWESSVSLRHRLLWSVLLPMLILLIINIAVVSKFGYDSANRRHDHFLLSAADTLMDQLHTRQGKAEFNGNSSTLSKLFEDKYDQVYYFLSGVQQNYRFGHVDLPVPPDAIGESPVYYFATYAGHPVRMMAAIMPDADGARVVVMVGKTLVLHHERAKEWIWRVLPAHFILMGLSAVLVWWGVGRGLRPLLHLRDEVTRRSSRDLHPLPEKQIITEIRPLIHSFNELMARLDQSLTSQRRFVTNAAHQLRTPLSGFKTQAELIMRMNNVDEIHRTVQQLHIAADHSGHLINQLLVLASSELGAQTRDSFTELDLSTLARKVTEYWVQTAVNKKIDLGFESSASDFSFKGNALLLGEMLSNLIDNALRYTQVGGRVTVRISRDDKKVSLEVEDNGPGIPEHERAKVFERFYRVQGTCQDGCGLGLSIVREIAHRHRAEIYALSGADERGTLMKIIFDF
ncbi:MAG: sensor histidine kinase [Gallionella sp.]|jgi:two-component system sensor histidine kinase TctE